MASEIQNHSEFFGSLDSYRIIQKGNERTLSPYELTPFGRPLERIPAQFREVVADFQTYLSETATKFFKITNRIVLKGSKIGEFHCQGKEIIDEKEVPYVHRWSDVYRKSLLAKLYKLEEYCKSNPEILKNITMITLTVAQRGKDQEEALLDLMKNYKKLFDVLRHEFGSIDYFYILEPHKTGYAHMHILYFRLFSESEKRHIWDLWENKYGAGNHEAFDFSEPAASEAGHCKKGEISYIRSYVMKYVSKGLRTKEMSKNVLLFNALLKKTKIRMWNCSRHLSKVMSRDEKEHSDAIEEFECLKVELHDSSLGETAEESFVKQVYPKPESAYKEPIQVFEMPKKPNTPRLREPSRKQKKVYSGYQVSLDTTFEEDYGDVEGVTVVNSAKEVYDLLKRYGY